MTAGATLSKFGKKVLLLEQHYKPGGCATTFKRKDFIVEVGLHEMSGLGKGGGAIPQIFDLLDVWKEVEFVKVPEFFAVFRNGEKFVFPHGYEKAIKALIDKYPEDEKGIRRLMKVMAGVRKEGTSLPRNPLISKLIYPLMPLLYPNLVEATKHTVGSWLDKYITNEDAKLDITSHLVYWGDDPYNHSMFYFGLPFSGFIENGGHFIKGGSQELSHYLASYIEKNGGKVLLGKRAEKIVTKNDKAVGVTISDSYNKDILPETVACDNVVANTAIPLVPDLLDEPYATTLKGKIEGIEDSCSLLCIYLGFNRHVKEFGVQHYSNVIRGEDVKTLKDLKPNHTGDWSKRNFIFVDYNQVDSQLAPAEKNEGVICCSDYLEQWEGLSQEDYKAKKEEVAQILLGRLDKQFPGIRDSIEYYEVSTSKTIKRYTLNPSGSVYGYAQTLRYTATKRFRNNFLLSNLYFGSAWAFPGGGFEGAITGGFLAALQMNNDNIWSENGTEHFHDPRAMKLKAKKSIDENKMELIFDKPADLEFRSDQQVYQK